MRTTHSVMDDEEVVRAATPKIQSIASYREHGFDACLKKTYTLSELLAP